MLDFIGLNRTFNELDLFRREFDRLFDQAVRGEVAGPATFSDTGRELGARFENREDAFVLAVDVPGVNPADVDLQITRDGITLRAHHEHLAPKGYSTHRQERGTWSLSRSWTLPVPVDPEQAAAEIKNGVLTVTMPKVPEVKPRRIEVKA